MASLRWFDLTAWIRPVTLCSISQIPTLRLFASQFLQNKTVSNAIHIRYSSADILKSLLGEYLLSLTAALLPVGYISSRICWFGHPSCQGRCFPSSVKHSILSLTAVTWVWLAVLTYFTSVAQRELFNSQPPDDDSRSRSVRRASYQQVASCHSPVHCVFGVAVINACCEILLQLSPCCLLSLDCTLIVGRASV